MTLRSTAALAFLFALAASAPTLGETPDEAHAAQTLRGDPQPTDSISFDPILFVWTLALFLGLLFVMNQVAWQPLLESLAAREKRIADIITEAEAAKAEARLLLADADKEFTASHDEVRRMLDKVRAEASQESEAMMLRAKQEAAAQRDEGVRAIQEAKDQALAELGAKSSGLADQIVHKVLGRSVRSGQPSQSGQSGNSSSNRGHLEN